MKNYQASPSALGMMTYAYEYIDSAMILDHSTESGNLNDRVSRFPVYFLVSHGIELTYKAYLLHKNIPYKHIYNEIGHDLKKCCDESSKQGLNFKYSAEDIVAIDLLSELNKDHQFRYIKIGLKKIPYWSIVEPLAVRLHQIVAKEVGARTFDVFYHKAR